MKRWKPVFYAITKAGCLLVFRGKEDFQDWLKNPFHSVAERAYLVKLKIDFVNDSRYKNSVKGYRLTQFKCKEYSDANGGGGVLEQFKLERVMDYGPNIAAAFAGVRGGDVGEFYSAMEALCRFGRNAGRGGEFKLEGGVGVPQQQQPQQQQQQQQGSRGSAFNFETI